ncbi:MAG: sensor histidine kinase [Methermicoccaceae archaeon]
MYRWVNHNIGREDVHTDEGSELNAVLESSHSGILFLDADGTVLRTNPAFEHLVGHTLGNVVGRSVFWLTDQLSSEECSHSIRDALKGERVDAEHTLLTPDGRRLDVVCRFVPLMDEQGRVKKLVVLIEDITQKKQAEQHYRALLNTLTEPAAVFAAPDGKLVDYNTALMSMSGYTREELDGMTFVDLLHPDDVPLVMERFTQRIQGKSPPNLYEVRCVDKQGRVLYFELSVSPCEVYGMKGVLVVARDLTHRRHMEEALKRSEERYRTIVQSSVNGILGVDSRGVLFEWNKALESITGVSRDVAVGKQVFDVISSLISDEPQTMRMLDVLKEELAKVLSGDISQYDSVPIELEIHSLDGKKKCIELKPFRVVEGEELLLIGIVMDITEKRRLLEELVEREHTFRAIAESSPAAIMLTDSNGNNIYVSPNIERLTGFPPEEFLGSVRWVVHPDDYERMSAFFRKAYERAEPGRHVECRIVKRDGKTAWASFSWEPILVDGKLSNMVVMIEDITAKKHAELEASRTLRELSILYEISARVRETLEPVKMLSTALSLCMELLELEFGAVYVKKGSHLELVDARSASEPFGECLHIVELRDYPLRQSLYAGKALITEDCASIFDSDTISESGRISSLAVVPIHYYGKLHGVMYLGRSLDALEFDAAFLCSLGELLGSIMHVSELYTSLKDSYEQLKSADELRAGFLDVINHELRTPLTTIYGYLSLLVERTQQLSDETAMRYAEGIVRGTERLMSLVERVAHAKKIEREECVLHLQDVDVYALVESAIAQHGQHAAKKSMTVELSGEHVMWEVDTDKLRIVLDELITNAIRYGRSAVRVSLHSAGGELHIEAWNDGESIPERALERVFDKFFIAHDVDRHSEGMGLGLFVVKQLVELHGGRVWVESDASGTTLHVVLPEH